MRKAVARFGDSTTTGGKVFAFSADMFDNGRRLALSGEKATCGNCSGSHPIIGTGTKMKDRGRCVVLDGDAVLCPCGKNKVLVSGDARVFVHVDGSKKASRSSDISTIHPMQPLITFDERFTLVDASTGEPISGIGYRLMSGSDVIATGITDSTGRTARFTTKDAANVKLQLRSTHV
jgi:uncharacterized Zn-binding protein involved in type VI secretion